MSDGLSGGCGRWRKGLRYRGKMKQVHIARALVTSRELVIVYSRRDDVDDERLRLNLRAKTTATPSSNELHSDGYVGLTALDNFSVLSQAQLLLWFCIEISRCLDIIQTALQCRYPKFEDEWDC